MITLTDERSTLYQWDTNRTVTLSEDLSDVTEVHFANRVFGTAFKAEVVDLTARIPDELLQSGKSLLCWCWSGSDLDGFTKVSREFNVEKRAKPAEYVFTKTDQKTIQDAIDAKNEAIKAKEAAETAYADIVKLIADLGLSV